MNKINEVEVFEKSLKELNNYASMLLSGKCPTKYIVGKVEMWAENIKHDAKFVDAQIKGEKNE